MDDILIQLRWVLLVLFLFTVSCSASSDVKSKTYDAILNLILTESVPFVSVDSLSRTVDDIVLLDAREREEYVVSRIAPGTSVIINLIRSRWTALPKMQTLWSTVR